MPDDRGSQSSKKDWESNTSNTVVGSKENNSLDALADSYLTQHTNRPTRIRGDDKPSLVDLVISDTSTPAEEIEHLPPLGDSDHALLQVKVSFEVASYVKKRLNFRKANFDAMKSFLRGTTIPDELDVNEKWLFLKGKITEDVKKFIPELNIKSNKNRRYTANRDILELVRKKKRLWKNFVNSKSPDDHKKYKASRNLLRKETRNLAQEMEQEIANNLKSNPKKFWSYVSQKTKRRETIPAIKREDGSFTQTALEKAEELSLFFKSVFVNEGPGLWQINIRHKCMEDNITFTEKEVLEEINALNTAKSAGVDNISPRILKEIGSEIAPLLSQIMTESWNTAILPDDWLRANIVPIFKSGNKSEATNYRPVSLTSIPCKLMERIIRKRIMTFLTDNDILSDKQCGFLSKRSTLLQLLKIFDQWTLALDNKVEVDVVYLDFRKAFDSVPHRRLIAILEQNGINGKTLNWIKAFLSGRQQRVVVKGHFLNLAECYKRDTSRISIRSSVVYDLHKLNAGSCGVELYLFADDAKLYREIQSDADQKILQDDLRRLGSWSSSSLLQFNEKKCVKMTLTTKKDSTERHYFMNTTKMLENVRCEKDLSVLTDHKLNFDLHFAEKIKMANSMLAIIKKCFMKLNCQSLSVLIKTLVRPHLEYCNQAWHPHFQKHRTNLENVQRRATRLIPSLASLPYEQRLMKLDLPTLDFRRKRGRMIEVYKILNGVYDKRFTGGMLMENDKITRGNQRKLVV